MSAFFSGKKNVAWLALPVMLSSCATIVSGGSPKVVVDGDVKDPVTIVTNKRTYANVTLPYEVKVARHGLDGQQIYVYSDVRRYKDIVLEKKTNAWAFGNILAGGFVGWGVDLLTNCVVKPAETYFYVKSEEPAK